MKNFYSLKVKEVESLTSDSVKIVLENSFPENFIFSAGQYITIQKEINDVDVRRSYSLSSCPGEGIEIGVRRIENGVMSTFLTKELKKGDYLNVMPPTGNFSLALSCETSHYVAFCAGSGITPIISMIKQVLNKDSESYFTLIYGNKTKSSMMFLEDLVRLERDYQSQLFIHYVFSREDVIDCLKGRIDSTMLQEILNNNSNLKEATSYFLCGPGEMINNVNQFLLDLGINQSKINFEKFYTEELPKKDSKENNDLVHDILSNVTVSVDGDDFSFELSTNGKTILDAAMDAGADVPFSCKGGVCCVCKAKVIEGEVKMNNNFSLSGEEVAEGFVLGCQSHPVSENVIIDFDEM